MKPCVIHWFRKGLRFHDNPALLSAIKIATENKITLIPLFIIDPHYGKTYKVGANRWRFLHQTLTDLDKTLKSDKSNLYVASGEPEILFKKFIKDWNVKYVTVRSKIFVQLRNLVIFEVFLVKFSAKKLIF